MTNFMLVLVQVPVPVLPMPIPSTNSSMCLNSHACGDVQAWEPGITQVLRVHTSFFSSAVCFSARESTWSSNAAMACRREATAACSSSRKQRRRKGGDGGQGRGEGVAVVVAIMFSG